MTLETITIPSKTQPPEYLLIALHGWGSNAQDLASLAPALNWTNTQMMFPNAPFDHPQVPGGKMWYDLQPIDPDAVNHSRQVLTDWLDSLETNTGIPPQRTFLMGFSQGGAMTLDVGFLFPFAGLCSLSGYLHPKLKVTATAPPTLLVHGTQDVVVPVAAAQRARETLEQQGVKVTYQEFPIDHQVSPQVVQTLKNFITNLCG